MNQQLLGFGPTSAIRGDIYDSTSHAVPFLSKIGIENDQLLGTDFMEFIADLATCAASTSEKIRRKWERRVSSSPNSYRQSVDELAQIDFDDVSSLRAAFVENAGLGLRLVDKFNGRSPEFAAQLKRKISRFQRTQSGE